MLWPVAGTDLRIPVDLAALPVYDRDRNFSGFRGFGVARAGDAVVDPEAPGFTSAGEGADRRRTHASTSEPTIARPAEMPAATRRRTSVDDPFRGEVPILTIVPKQERRHSDKVIRLAEHRPRERRDGLSPGERIAFREIGDRLKKESGVPAEPRRSRCCAPTTTDAPQAEPSGAARRCTPSSGAISTPRAEATTDAPPTADRRTGRGRRKRTPPDAGRALG